MAKKQTPPDEREPICDINAECRVLASILEESTIYDMVSDRLRSEHFYSEANRLIYGAMGEIRNRDDDINLPSVRDYLYDTGKLARVEEKYLEFDIFVNTPAVTDPDREVGRIIERFQLRQMQLLCKEFLATSYTLPMEEISEMVSKFEAQVSSLNTEAVSGVNGVNIREAVKSYAVKLQERLVTIKRLQEEGLPLIEITTGLSKLDELIGGLHRGSCTIVAGRPGMGKSALGMKVCRSVAGTKNYSGGVMASMFISLEMPIDDLIMRIACLEGSVDIKEIKQNALGSLQQSRYFKALNDVSRLPIQIVEDAYNLNEIRAAIRRAKISYAKDGIELTVVIIDYLQLIMERQDKTQTRENVVGFISRSLKQLAKSENLCIVLLSQLNRECENSKDKRPSLPNLRESGSIEQDADEVVFMLRKEYYWDIKEVKGMCELIVAKQRNGPVGSVLVAFRNHCARLDDLAFGDDYDEDEYVELFERWKSIPKSGRKAVR